MNDKDLQSQIDYLASEKERFDEAVRLQADVWTGMKPAVQPLLLTCRPTEGMDGDWPVYNYLEIHNNKAMMFSNGLRDAVLCARGGAQAVPSIRANMGCGIIPTMFGVEQLLFEDKMPWVKGHLSKDRLREMGPDDLSFGEDMQMAFAHMDYISERIKGTGCRVFPLDLQGAFDTAHIVYGDALFTDLYDDPDFVHHLLDLSCHAIIKGMEACLAHIPDSGSTIAHYDNLAIPRSRGGVKISEDTSTLLSKSQIEQFVSPYLKRLLKHFKGGYVHYCGSNPHLYQAVLCEEWAFGLNFGNPEKHDMDAVLRACAQRGIVYYGDIPARGGDDLASHFLRCLSMSRQGGRHWLLPVVNCTEGSQTSVMEAWMTAQEQGMYKPGE